MRIYFLTSPLLASIALLGCKTSGTIAPQSVQPVATVTQRLPNIDPEKQTAEIQPVAYQTPVAEVSPSDIPLNKTKAPATVHTGGVDVPSGLPLNLATALELTQGQNPRVAFAQAQVAQAYAQHEAAHLLWLPNIRAGMNYNKHEGRLQDVEGNNFEISRGAAFGGLGANAVGAGSPAIPGVYLNMHTTDLIFQRRITGYNLQARKSQSAAALNDQLLDTALAFLALLEAAQRTAIAADTLQHGEELAKFTADFVRTGAGNQADADRAQTVLALFRTERLRAEEAVATSSARVAQQLSADPTLKIVPQESNVVPIELIPVADGEITTLVATGLSHRPELAASRSLVCEAVNRLEREKYAPWLPSVLLGTSYGAFGAGTGGSITNGADRFDFDSAAWWEVRNLGAGERTARENAQAQIKQARMREIETMDLIAREIAEGATQVQSRLQQMEVARQGIDSAQQSYKRNRERIQNVQGLPIEMLQSIQALDQAQREYLRTVVDYNTAQFRLHRALGCPIRDVSKSTDSASRSSPASS
jgi:outer membrane protein TolC